MTYKHKTHAVDTEGKVISNADVDFYIDDVCFLLLPFILLMETITPYALGLWDVCRGDYKLASEDLKQSAGLMQHRPLFIFQIQFFSVF